MFYQFGEIKIPKWIIKRMEEWKRIQYKPRKNQIKTGKMNIRIFGFDTETIDGYAKLLCCSDGTYTLIEKAEDWLQFLTRYKFRDSLNFFWNIDFDFMALLKYTGKEMGKKIYFMRKAQYGKYEIKWTPRKAFVIKKDKKNYYFFDLFQYYMMSLDKAGKKYLGEGKIDIEIDKMNNPKFWRENLNKIIKYCTKDAEITAKLGELLQSKLNQIGISFEKPYSNAQMSLRYFKDFTNSYVFKPTELQKYAYLTYFGGRFELIKRGYFDKVWCYDINSAYPYQISQLPNINYCKEIQTKTEKEGEIGFVKILIEKIEDELISPICYRDSGLVFYPNAKNIITFITQDELDFIKEHFDIKYKFLDGWYLIPEVEDYPFKDIIQIYKKRKEIKKKDPVFQLVLKIIMNSLYGKFAERVGQYVITSNANFDLEIKIENEIFDLQKKLKAGRVFCPAYATLITARTRLQLLREALKKPDEIVAMHTDSITTTKPFIKEGNELGEWSLDMKGEALYLFTGIYTIRNSKETKTRLRGIHTKSEIDLIDLIKQYPNETNLNFVWKKAYKLGEILFHCHKLNFDMLCQFDNYTKNLYVNNEQKRIWEYQPKTFGELLYESIDSIPKYV